MKERLIEHWLDSIGERGYQPAFVQMLGGEGHTVVHSTRHSPIEFGKDVISINAHGVPCAYQLKGNPGARLTLSQWRDIRDQVTELVEQPIVYPGVPDIPHKCYLVTNGEVDEEVQRAIDDLNRNYQRRQLHPNQRLTVISRGKLLRWANKHAGDYWPNDFSIHEKLVKMYNVDGREPPDLELFSDTLAQILRISTEGKTLPRTAFHRSMLSAAIFVTLATRNYVREENHNAVIGVWTALLATYAGASELHEITLEGKYRRPYDIARSVIFDSLYELLLEVHSKATRLTDANPTSEADINQVYLEGRVLSDHLLWNARATKSLSLLAILRIESQRNPSSIELGKDQMETISRLCRPKNSKITIWGESAVTQVFAHILAQRISDATMAPNFAFYHVLRWITQQALHSERKYIPTPYHGLENCIRDQLRDQQGIGSATVENDTQKKSSYMAEGLLHCFVRTNLKSYAKSIWPDMTRLLHKSYVPDNRWEYCLWRSENGRNLSKQFERRKNWADLQAEAASIDMPAVPATLRNDPVILLSFIIYFPHRATPEVMRFLHYVICGTWFMPFPRPII